MKFKVAHFQKEGKWLINGGTLYATETEFILKCFFATVARFPRGSAHIEQLPHTDILYRRFQIRSGDLCYTLYLFPDAADALVTYLNERQPAFSSFILFHT